MLGIFLLILGIAIGFGIFIWWMYSRRESDERPITPLMVFTCAAIAFLIFFISFITVIPVGHVGVPILFGKVQMKSLPPGLHLVNPFLNVKKLDGRIKELTMHIPAGTQEGESSQTTMDILMNDGLRVFLDATLWYRLDLENAHQYVLNIAGDPLNTVALPQLRGAARDVAVSYSSNDIYAHPQKREELGRKIFERFCEKAAKMWVVGVDFTIRKVKLPDELEKAIERKMQADQEAQEMAYRILKEEKEKERKIIEAKGIAESNRIIQQSLTKEYLQWYFIQNLPRIAESPSNTVMFFPYGSDITPVFDVTKFLKNQK